MKNIDSSSEIKNALSSQTINDSGANTFKHRYSQAVGSMVYIPQENREIGMENFVDATVIASSWMTVKGKDLSGEEVAIIDIQKACFLLRNKAPHQDLPTIPIENFRFYLEGSLADFDERDYLGIDYSVLELTFKSEDIANAFTQLALIDGGAQFALTFSTGYLEMIILEARRG